MPPRIPVRFPWTAKSSLAPIDSARAFTSTAPYLALGPESPNYIDVPKPVQPTYPPKPRVKGFLPVPRDVFKIRSKVPKASQEFIDASTRDPKPENIKTPAKYSRDADYRLYKQRLAEARKQALREGVKELHERKTIFETRQSARANKATAENMARRLAPPKEVDILTSASVQQGIRDFLSNTLHSTSRSNISEGRRKAFTRRMEAQAAVRQRRLHDLYTNAREFIVDEQQLDEAIEKAFGTEESPVGWDTFGKEWLDAEGKSPWHGPMPDGVGELLQKLKGSEGVGLAQERVKKVAEELTGGKM